MSYQEEGIKNLTKCLNNTRKKPIFLIGPQISSFVKGRQSGENFILNSGLLFCVKNKFVDAKEEEKSTKWLKAYQNILKLKSGYVCSPYVTGRLIVAEAIFQTLEKLDSTGKLYLKWLNDDITLSAEETKELEAKDNPSWEFFDYLKKYSNQGRAKLMILTPNVSMIGVRFGSVTALRSFSLCIDLYGCMWFLLPYLIILYHAIPYHTIPYHTIPYHTNTVPCHMKVR